MNDIDNDFIDGVKVKPDMNNKKEGPHMDAMVDIRKETGGVDKTRISPAGDVLNGETQIENAKLKWDNK